jgi:zinc transport system substrate-binding protein
MVATSTRVESELAAYVTGTFESRAKTMRYPGLTAVLLAAMFSLQAVADEPEAVRITVSILPQAWFAETIGGERVAVEVLVGPGHSPATYEPTPRQMAALEQADLFLSAGVPFEQGLVPRIQAMTAGPLMAGPEPGHYGHHHEIDPHTWLDPIQALAMADTICRHLQQLAPGHAEEFGQRRDLVAEQMRQLDDRIRLNLAGFAGRSFLVFHPAFGHFAARYGLVQVPVEDGGHEPGPRHLGEVIDRAKADGSKSIVVQPQFSEKSARTVADAIDGEVVVLDPLAADYPENLMLIARTLAERFTAEDRARAEDGP